MRKYNDQHKLLQVICNQCGKEVDTEHFILKDDFFNGYKSWGYFSKRDGEVDHWDLCEQCYDHITSGFKIPMETCEKHELMDE